MDVLLFSLAGIRYALPAADVNEVAPAVPIVPLPDAPPIVEGVVNVHGQVVPVLDIRARFRLPRRPLAYTDHLIVARAGERVVALRADRVLDLVHVDDRQIDDLRHLGPHTEYVSGVAKLADGLVLIHDLRTFLQDAEALALDEALSGVSTALGGAV